MKNVHYMLILLFPLSLSASDNLVTRKESPNEIIYSNNNIVAIFYKKEQGYLATEKVLTQTGPRVSCLKNPKYFFEMLENQYLHQLGTPEAKEFKEPGQFEQIVQEVNDNI